ncbi:MAG: hypothetical protein HRU21_04835 [Pseudomonadales bacterium]|nr:hypothetical protein [Pseudomonadales bacterium]
MTLLKKTAIATALIASASAAQAETFWTNTSLTYLAGSEYLNPFSDEEADGSVITFEHAGAYSWGKSFSFVDIVRGEDEDDGLDETYLELGADISLTGGKGFSDAVIKDVYLVTQLENGNPSGFEGFVNYLGGVGVRWNAPGFIFLDTNIYYRSNDAQDDNAQITVAWGLPFNIGGAAFSFDGFLDATTETENDFGDVEATFHTQPQLKLDVGNFFGETNKYYVGVEVDYWQNKFGVDGADQTAVQLMAHVNF